MPDFVIENTRIAYDVVRSRRRRTVAIEVRPDGHVVVRAPMRTPDARLREFVTLKALWVARHVREALRRQDETPPAIGELGVTVPVFGRAVAVEVRLIAGLRKYGAELSDDALHVVASPGADQTTTRDNVRAVLEAWYRAEGLRHLTERIAHYAKLLGVTPKSVHVKQQARRWGSCSAKGSLNFNWRLAMAPPDVVDYVVAHEVAHMRVLNHSKRFWAVVASVFPDHASARRWLRREGWRLML